MKKASIGSGPVPRTKSSTAVMVESENTLSSLQTKKCIRIRPRSSASTYSSNLAIWELPDILFYRVGQFVSSPTERASLFCHKLALLCKASYRSILMDENKSIGLWDLILRGDYGIVISENEKLRHSKRLKRSPAHKVRDAHKLMIANTELAYNDLWELGYSSKKNALTKQKLINILNEYGPVMLNRTMPSGGNFLVEVCRSRNASQNIILHCVQELVERRGAFVNIPTNDAKNSSLTALCVASVRGMPRVVAYLLSNGATNIRCAGKFKLYKNPKKCLRCTGVIPLEFSQQMLAAETKEGATKGELKDLKLCIKLLKQVTNTLINASKGHGPSRDEG